MTGPKTFFYFFILGAVLGGVTEGFLRVSFYVLQGRKFRPVQFLVNDSQYGYRPVPGAKDLTGDFEWNSLGFRSPEFPVKKEKGRFRVFCVGGSTTYGTGNAENTTYPAVLQTLLPNHYEVINAGVSGWGIQQHYLRLKELVNFEPDAIIHESIVNALIYPEPYFRNGSWPTYPLFNSFLFFKIFDKALSIVGFSFHYPLTDKATADKGYQELQRRLQEEGPERYQTTLEAYIRYTQEKQIALLLIIPPFRTDSRHFKTRDKFDELSLATRERVSPLTLQLANRYQIPYADLRGLFKEDKEISDLFYDPVHPLASGQERIAKELENRVKEAFSKAGTHK